MVYQTVHNEMKIYTGRFDAQYGSHIRKCNNAVRLHSLQYGYDVRFEHYSVLA